MIQGTTYTTLHGERMSLTTLDAEERRVVDDLIARSAAVAEWTDYANYYMPTVGNFYSARGLSRRQITETSVWKIAQDLNGRLMVQAGMARDPALDYRDRLSDLIRSAFPTQRAFCEATGLSEALRRIGYRLDIVPAEKA